MQVIWITERFRQLLWPDAVGHVVLARRSNYPNRQLCQVCLVDLPVAGRPALSALGAIASKEAAMAERNTTLDRCGLIPRAPAWETGAF